MAFCALIAAVFLFAGPHLTEASFALYHPQAQFCSAGFVLRAEVLTNFDGKSNAYDVKVLDLFKDEVDLSRAEGTRFLGARLKLKLFYSRYLPIRLRVGNVYILAGQLVNGKLQLSTTDWIFPFGPSDNVWENLASTQKEGVYFHYRRGCKCQIGRCYGDTNCLQKVQGCEYSVLEKRPRFDMCRMKHQFCEIKEAKDLTRCSWKTRATNEFKDCESETLSGAL